MNELSLVDRLPNEYLRSVFAELMREVEVEHAKLAEGLIYPVRSLSATTSAVPGDGILVCNATGAAFTVFLPEAARCKEKALFLKKTDASANAVLIDANGSETIDGSVTSSLASQWDGVLLFSDGTQWLKK